MNVTSSFHDNQPITWWNRVPIYGTGVLTALFAAGVLICAVLGLGRFLEPFAFMPPAFLAGAFWQPVTYAFADQLSFFTPLGLICFYMWAVEIEKYLGRQRFFTLFGALLLAQPLVCLLWWKAGVPVAQWGNYEIMAAVLIGFATLYPNVEYLFGWVPLKWFAFACFVCGSLMQIAERDWVKLSLLWVECALAFGYIRWAQLGGEITLPKFSRAFARKPHLRALPDPVRRPRRAREDEPVEATSEIDALLDKIAQNGIGSLTPRERARLEKAREALLKKPQR